ncbi:MAG: SCP2 sterol-binding domain-containing protein [Solirubrobacteraceae bacterium]
MRGRRASFADRKAELLRRWVAGTPQQRLEAVMRSPLRRLLLWQIFKTMRQRVDAGRTAGVDAVVEFRIRQPTGSAVDRYQVAMADGVCRTTRHGEQAPTVALDMDSVSFLCLVAGAAGARTLFLTGRLRVRGDFLLATRLPTLLNIPRAPGRRS